MNAYSVNVQLINNDCLIALKDMEENSVDSIVTDPPYELGFMGKAWDNTGIAYRVDLWKEVLRVLKPGGHLLSFGGSRTYHRMACAIEDAGFEIRDQIMWVYGSGFPKSLNIGKVMDKFLKTGNASWNGTGDSSNGALGYSKLQHKQDYRPEDYSNRHQNKSEITEEKAKAWEGYGTALKPAHEPIVLARKPLSEKTVAENCLKWGVGGLAIDECRVGTEVIQGGRAGRTGKSTFNASIGEKQEPHTGRFPANFIHDGSQEVLDLFPDSNGCQPHKINSKNNKYAGWGSITNKNGEVVGYDGKGSAARFFYCAKASSKERNEGLEDFSNKESKKFDGGEFKSASTVATERKSKNHHPTVKPILLMKYLICLVTPKNGLVLDPFLGSGSTGIAAKELGYRFVGIEQNKEYFEIAKTRIERG